MPVTAGGNFANIPRFPPADTGGNSLRRGDIIRTMNRVVRLCFFFTFTKGDKK
jgi:hypothetical protein